MFTDNLYPLLENGIHVPVKYKTGEWRIFSPYKDEDGNYRDSDIKHFLEKAKQHISTDVGFSKNKINELAELNDWQIVYEELFRTPYTPLKVGQKVGILKSIEETDSWDDIKKTYPDMTGEVKDVFNEYNGFFYRVQGDGNRHSIGAEYLYPLPEEEENLSGEEVSVTIKGKTYKAVIK